MTSGDERRVVVFDLGNVLIPWDRRRLFARLIADPAELDHFCDHVLTMEENAVLDLGTPLPTMAAALAERHPAHREVIMAFAERWTETVGPAIDGSVELLAELIEAGHRCLALSNWGADTFAMVEDRYPFLAWFEALVISGREGVVKPDPAIFQLLCDRHAVDPANALFVDDAEPNVATASSLGFDTVLFTTPESLRIELEHRSLLPRR